MKLRCTTLVSSGLAALLVAAACREIPLDSGTPLRADESLDEGVARSQAVGSSRPVSLLASTDRVAADVAALLGPQAAHATVRLLPPENRTGIPAPAFGGLERQLLRGVREAGERHGVRFVVGGGDADADYELFTRVVGRARGDGSMLYDYLLREVDANDREAALWRARHAVVPG